MRAARRRLPGLSCGGLGHDAGRAWYPDQVIGRLATKRLSPYVLLVDTLAGVQEQLPPRLVRAERQPADPPEVMEIWFAQPCRRDLLCR